MPTWRVTYTLEDDATPKKARRDKTFIGEFADYAAASAAETALRTDIDNATSAGIIRVQLTEDTPLSGTATVGSNLFEVASVTVPINSFKRANFRLPAPVGALQGPNNVVDTSAAEWTDLADNFAAAVGWEVSDGEHIDTSIGYGDGKLIMVRSGVRFS